jgi:hypothetical protein
VGLEVAQHLEYLFNKGLPPLGHQQRRAAVGDAAHRLEERYLRGLKAEEAMRFSEFLSDGAIDADFEETLDTNQRIKQNELVRNRLIQNVSDRR